jgi:hypothetical protein
MAIAESAESTSAADRGFYSRASSRSRTAFYVHCIVLYNRSLVIRFALSIRISYSYRRESIGLVHAAFTVCRLMANTEISNTAIPAITKISDDMVARYGNLSIQLFIENQTNGTDSTIGNSTSLTYSFVLCVTV